jgi:hypothetical protein
MSALGNRLSKLEAQAKPGGGVIIMVYLDEADAEGLEQAERQAAEQGNLLVIIQKFGHGRTIVVWRCD